MPRLEPADWPQVLVSTRSMAENKTAAWRTLRPVVELARCTGCMLCWKFCPDACVELGDDGRPAMKLDWCKGCGICAAECPPRCIEMTRESA